MSTFNELIDFTRSTTGTYLDSVVYGGELVTNGNFATDSDWAKGTGWAISGGTASKTAGTGSTLVSTTLNGTIGKSYLLTFDLTLSAGVINSTLGAAVTPVYNSSGSYAKILKPTTTGAFQFYGSAAFAGSIDNVSVKEVIGGQVSAGTPLLRTAAINEPRLEYDASGNPLGLLIEEARTNRALYSQDMTHSSWNKIDVTVAAAPIAAPDGTMTANHVVKTGSNGHLSKNSIGNTNERVSVWARTVSGTGTMYMEYLYSSASQTVTVTEEWQRFDAQLNNDNAYVANFRGDATLTEVYLWGAQVETGAFPTSYIPTSGSTVTRAADVSDVPVERFGYNTGKGSIVVYAQSNKPAVSVYAFELSESSGDRMFSKFQNAEHLRVRVNFADTAVIDAGNIETGSFAKLGARFANNDFAVSIDGNTPVTDTNGAVNLNASELKIGQSQSNSEHLNGHIKQIQYYPKRLSNTELQLLTQPSASPTMNLTFDGQATSTLVEGLHD